MKISDLLRMAVKNLTSRKLRTFLTILGVIIGSISIIVMVSFGHGITASNKNLIESMGNVKEITVHNKENTNANNSNDDMAFSMFGGETNLNTTHETELMGYPHVEAVVGTINLSGYQIVANNRYESWVQIMGIRPEHIKYLDLELEDGAGLSNSMKNIVVFGNGASQDFYDSRGSQGRNADNLDLSKAKLELKPMDQEFDEFGQPVNTSNNSKKLKYGGTLADTQRWEFNYNAFINIDYARELLIEQDKKNRENQDMNIGMGSNSKKRDPKTRYDSLRVIVEDPSYVEDLKNTLEADGYTVTALTDVLQSFEEQTAIIKWIFGGIGAVSLLVAAIGISNTMVMSIQERTREIGVMKVIGASLQDIKKLFLVEASMIGFLGGVVGVTISYIISHFVNKLATQALSTQLGSVDDIIRISIIPPFLAILALVFSALIGLVSGYFPARRAMKLSALDAIRSD